MKSDSDNVKSQLKEIVSQNTKVVLNENSEHKIKSNDSTKRIRLIFIVQPRGKKR